MNIDDIKAKYGIQHNDAKGDGHNWFNKMQSSLSHLKEIEAGEEKRKSREIQKNRNEPHVTNLIFKARDEGLKSIERGRDLIEAAIKYSAGLKSNAQLQKFIKDINNATSGVFRILTEAAKIKRNLGV